MDPTQRIEQALEAAILSAQGPGCPPGFAQALRYAVFPGGARIRPRLCLAVGWACGDTDPETTDAAATAIELLHCASLVHDDLPCFDDSTLRRGRPSVHCAYGERLAVLAGDALIVLAFEVLARRIVAAPQNLSRVMATVASCAGAPIGICAGQAWECESEVVLADYHRAKTGSLFVAATVAGAESVGAPTAAWRLVGERLGEAYQVADDLGDALESSREMGKPLGRDSSLGGQCGQGIGCDRCRAAAQGPGGQRHRCDPANCQGSAALQALIAGESRRILPEELARLAA